MGIGFAEDLLVCVALGVDMVRAGWAKDADAAAKSQLG
jgi:queuine/archaeosine tRNA-ribosyltransferase